MQFKTKQAPGTVREIAGRCYYGSGAVWIRLVRNPQEAAEAAASIRRIGSHAKFISSTKSTA